MIDAEKILKLVNGINTSDTATAVAALQLHLAELANVCIHQGAAIRELQSIVRDLKDRPGVSTKPFR